MPQQSISRTGRSSASISADFPLSSGMKRTRYSRDRMPVGSEPIRLSMKSRKIDSPLRCIAQTGNACELNTLLRHSRWVYCSTLGLSNSHRSCLSGSKMPLRVSKWLHIPKSSCNSRIRSGPRRSICTTQIRWSGDIILFSNLWTYLGCWKDRISSSLRSSMKRRIGLSSRVRPRPGLRLWKYCARCSRIRMFQIRWTYTMRGGRRSLGRISSQKLSWC